MEHPELEPARPRGPDGKFVKGQPVPAQMPRRKKGVANRITRDIKYGLTEAAIRHGSNGRGKGGLVGFFQYLLLTDLRAFANLIGRLVPLQLNADVNGGGTVNISIASVPSGHFLSLEEARAAAGYGPGGVLELKPGINIGTPPSTPALTVIENDTTDDAPPTDKPAPPVPPARRTDPDPDPGFAFTRR